VKPEPHIMRDARREFREFREQLRADHVATGHPAEFASCPECQRRRASGPVRHLTLHQGGKPRQRLLGAGMFLGARV
jgi:hypothetical protein